MQVAICDDDVTDRTKVGELLAQKMRKRGEPVERIWWSSSRAEKEVTT